MATADLDRCLHFYVDLLGLKLLVRRRQSNGGEVAFVVAGGAMLEIAAPPAPVAPVRPVPRDEAGVRHITFRVEDVVAAYTALLAEGVTGVEPPRDAFNRDMLQRVAFVADPDGVTVELAQK
jgi:glyoxylase I family protein